MSKLYYDKVFRIELMSYKVVDDTEILADLREPCGHG